MTASFITGVGLACATGLDAASACAAIRAGVGNLVSWDRFAARGSDPSRASRGAVAPIPFGARPRDPARRALIDAVSDLVETTRLGRSDLSRIALVTAGPLAGEAREALAPLGRARSEVREPDEGGRTGFMMAVGWAADALESGAETRCAVVAADSRLLPDALDALEAQRRWKGPDASEGLVPGECGVALLLETADAARERGAEPLARIGARAFATEPQPFDAGEPSTAEGMTLVVDGLVGGLTDRTISWVLSDLNGERYRMREWGLALSRRARAFADPLALWHPADCVGDTGAAVSGLLVAMAVRAFARDHAPADEALLLVGDDDGRRAGLAVHTIAEDAP